MSELELKIKNYISENKFDELIEVVEFYCFDMNRNNKIKITIPEENANNIKLNEFKILHSYTFISNINDIIDIKILQNSEEFIEYFLINDNNIFNITLNNLMRTKKISHNTENIKNIMTTILKYISNDYLKLNTKNNIFNFILNEYKISGNIDLMKTFIDLIDPKQVTNNMIINIFKLKNKESVFDIILNIYKNKNYKFCRTTIWNFLLDSCARENNIELFEILKKYKNFANILNPIPPYFYGKTDKRIIMFANHGDFSFLVPCDGNDCINTNCHIKIKMFIIKQEYKINLRNMIKFYFKNNKPIISDTKKTDCKILNIDDFNICIKNLLINNIQIKYIFKKYETHINPIYTDTSLLKDLQNNYNINAIDKIIHNKNYLTKVNNNDNFYKMILLKYKYLSKLFIKDINNFIFITLLNTKFYQ